MGDLYWIWDKHDGEWSVGERDGTRWLMIDMDGSMTEEEFQQNFIMGERLERPEEPPLHV